MTAASHLRTILGFLVAATALTPSADALITFNEGRETIDVTANYGINYESNLFAHAGGAGDHSQRFSLGVNYARRAGLIKVKGGFILSMARFQDFVAQNYNNPSASLSFSKDSGRLTGSLSLNGARESSSDTAANLRASSWNYSGGLHLRYPINSRYYFTSQSDLTLRDYQHAAGLFNVSTYGETINLYYRYNSKLDLLGGYRVRVSDAQGGSNSLDHDVHLGATGTFFPKLIGTLSAGYEWRNETTARGGKFSTMTSSFALSWPMSTRVKFNGGVSKDFTTTATDITVDATSASLSSDLALWGKVNVHLGLSYTSSRYLGREGGGRKDHGPGFNTAVSFALTTHFSATAAYSYNDNVSNVVYSNFRQHTASLSLSATF